MSRSFCLKISFCVIFFLFGNPSLLFGQAYREGAYNSFKIYKDLLDKTSKEATPVNPDQMGRYLFLIDPLITGLGQKYNISLKEALKQSIVNNNRKLFHIQLLRLILLDTQDLIDSIAPDNSGWRNAKNKALRAAINYQLIMDDLQKKHPDPDEKIKTGFKNLETVFSNLDLTSFPDKPDKDKKFLIENLSLMRQAIEKD